MAEPRQRFSFSQTAAQQPERERFSFSQTAPQKQPTLNEALNKQFTSRGFVQKYTPPVKPVTGTASGAKQFREETKDRPQTISQGPKESLLDKFVKVSKETRPSRLGSFAKNVVQGSAREVVSLGRPDGSPVYPVNDVQRFLFGNEPFNTETVGREYADIIGMGESVSPGTARTIGVFAGILSLPSKLIKGIKGASTLISKTDDVKLIENELKRIGLDTKNDEAINFVKSLKDETNTKKIEDSLTNFIKKQESAVPPKERFSFSKTAKEGETSTGRVTTETPPRSVDVSPVAPARTPTPSQVPTTPARFSFADTAKQAPASIVRQTTPSPTGVIPATRTNITRSKIEAGLDEARFIDSEVIPNNPPTQTLGRPVSGVPVSTRFVKDRVVQVTEEGGKVRMFRIPEEGFDEVKRLIDDGRTPDTPISMNRAVRGKIFHITAKTPEQMLTRENVIDGGYITASDIERASKETSEQTLGVGTTSPTKSQSKLPITPAQAASAERAEQVIKSQPKQEKAVQEAVDSKRWESNPEKAHKESIQEVSKEYSGTVSDKGFISEASTMIEGVKPIKNNTAKARNFAKDNDVPIDLPEQTLVQYGITQLQDTAFRLGFVQKQLNKAGVKISDDANAYLQREAYIGRASAKIEKMHSNIGMKAGNTSGIFPRMRKDNISIEDLDEYMKAKAAVDRNKRIASLKDGVPDGGSGLTNAEAADILARYKGNTKIESYSKEFRDSVITPRLQLLVDSGILTKEQVANITKYEPNYVPFKVAEFDRVQGGDKGFSVKSSGVKGLRGSARKDRTNSIMQSVQDYQDAIQRSEKNKSLQAMGNLIEENPDKSLWEVKGVQYIPQYDKTGELQFLRQSDINPKTSVEFWKDGKAYEIRFHDEALAKVFTQEGSTKPIKALIKVNNYLRAVNTVINPEFMITNAIRDVQTAIVTAGGEKGALVAAKILKDYPKASKGIWQAVRNESDTGWAKIYNEMVDAGGRTGWFDLMEVGESTKQVSKMVNRYNSTKTSDSLMRAVDSAGKLISDMNEVAEMSVRVSAYKQLVDGGMSKTKAANYAKNMTVNFNKRGNLGMFLNSAYLFANAGIQGSARIITAMKYPKVRRITYGIAASAYGINELNYAINPEGYARVQDFEKERNLIVMLPLDGNKYNLPGISGDPSNGYYFKMPLPYGFNVFKVAGDTAYDVVNKKITNAEAMKKMLSSFNAAFNPLSSGSAIQTISPTITDPFVASWENKNWFGAPIMPEQPAFAPAVRDSDRYFTGARDISVGTAQFLNRLTGGNTVTAGAIDVSPETMDLVIDTLGGGLGNFIAQTIDGTISSVKGDIPTPDEMPFVRKLIDTPFEKGEQSTMFELLNRSATEELTGIEKKRFVESSMKALEKGDIDTSTAKRTLKQFNTNIVNQKAGEVLSLMQEGKSSEALEVINNAPPDIGAQIEKLIKDDLERRIKRRESKQK